MVQYGAEMWIDIARFGYFHQGEFLINGVTGADEYTALVNNNLDYGILAKGKVSGNDS